jgi:hypothetical protein
MASLFDYVNDHPPPHIHVRYGEQDATIEIASGRVQGQMSKHALQLIWTWLELHSDAIQEDWELARRQEPLKPIPPLD